MASASPGCPLQLIPWLFRPRGGGDLPLFPRARGSCQLGRQELFPPIARPAGNNGGKETVRNKALEGSAKRGSALQRLLCSAFGTASVRSAGQPRSARASGSFGHRSHPPRRGLPALILNDLSSFWGSFQTPCCSTISCWKGGKTPPSIFPREGNGVCCVYPHSSTKFIFISKLELIEKANSPLKIGTT